MRLNLLLALLIWLIPSYGCKMQKSSTDTVSDTMESEVPIFLDSAAASIAIVDDDVDGFFDDVTLAEVSIEMKKPLVSNDLSQAKAEFKDFLRTQVEDFTAEEIKYMTGVFEEVNKRIKNVNPSLLIPELKLVKIKLDHYGPDVYYTRGNAIFLPKNTLKRNTIEGQTNVMLHEIWHILSRNHKVLRENMYALIGFQPHNKDVKLPQSIAQKVLINPDGVSKSYAIDLGDGINAIPLIVSTRADYSPDMPNFFDYIQFDLFQIDERGMVLTTPTGKTTIPPKNNASFFKQIKDNTQYIIHPDEIIADNFMLAVNANMKKKYDDYSPEGKKLIQDILTYLKAFPE